MGSNWYKSLKILTFITILAVIVSCDKREDYVPYVYVNFTVDLAINNNLATPGYSEIFKQAGYGGVILFCEYYDYSAPANSIYHAYDATCTYELSDSCSVVDNDNGFYATCPCCSTKYELLTGNPIDGIAKYGLKSYSCTVMGTKLYVRNY